MERLFIRVDDGQDTIHGVGVLAGLQAAFNDWWRIIRGDAD